MSAAIGENRDSWTDLTAAIASSAGRTEETYETMTNTVQGQFTILKSTIQEVQLALFDGMSDGMSDLLSAWVEVFQLVGSVLADAEAGIASSWGSTMGNMAESVRANRAEIAGMIINMVEAFGNLARSVAGIIPHLRSLGALLLSIFIARKVYTFIGALIALKAAFLAAAGGAGALSAAINSMTLGIPALVGGLVAGVTALLAFGSSSSDAADKAADLQERMERLRAAEELWRSSQVAGLSENENAHNDWLHAVELQLQGSGALTNQIKREIEAIRNLSAEERQAKVASGEFFQATVNGESALISMGMAARIAQANVGDLSDEMEQQTTASMNAAVAAVQASMARSTALEAEAAQAVTDAAHADWRAEREFNNLSLRDKTLQALAQRAADMRAIQANLLLVQERIAGEAEVELATRGRLLETVHGQQDAMRNSIQLQERERAASAGTDTGTDDEERERRRAEWSKKRIAAMEKIAGLEFKIAQAARDAAGQATEHWTASLNERLDRTRDTYAKLAGLYSRGSQRRIAVEEAEAAAISSIRSTAALEQEQEIVDAITESQSRLESAGASEIQAFRRQQDEKIISARGAAERMIAAFEEGSQERVAAVERAEVQIANLVRQLSVETEAERSRISLEATEQIAQQREEMARAEMGRLAALAREEAQAVAEAQEAGGAAVTATHALYADKRAAIERELQAEIAALLSPNGEVTRLQAERDALLLQLTDDMGAERLAIVEHYEGLIAAAQAGESGGDTKDIDNLSAAFQRLGAAAGKNLSEGFQHFGTVLAGAKSQLDGVLDSLGDTAGAKKLEQWIGSIGDRFGDMGDRIAGSNLGKAFKGASGKAAHFMTGAADKAGAAWEGMANSAIGKTVVGAVGLAGEAAKGAAKMAGGIGLAIASGAAAAGKAVQLLGKGIKSVKAGIDAIAGAWSAGLDAVAAMTGFTFNLSDAVGSVNDQMAERAEIEAKIAAGGMTGDELEEANAQLAELPASAGDAAKGYVTDLVGGAVDMVKTFAEAAPVLLQELAAQIPDLINAIAEALPGIINGIAAAIPQIVQAIVGAIPAVIEALVRGLPVILSEILEAIPVVIEAIGQALPQIIGAVADALAMIVEALPGILEALLQQLPTIIEALVGMLDTLIIAVVDAIPKIITVLIEQLPGIVLALVDGVLVLVVTLLEQLPTLFAEVVKLIPDMIRAVVALIPKVITSIVDALPAITEGLIEAIPTIIEATIQAIPDIIMALIEAIPIILKALFLELIPGLLIAAGEFSIAMISGLWQFFKDVVKEIMTLGIAETQTFGDTPGVQHTARGGAVGFAAGDYFAAAQNPLDLLKQAAQAVGGSARITPAISGAGSGGGVSMPALEAIGSALMAAADSMAIAAVGGGQGGGDLRVTVTAEGKTLDDVLYIGGQRGHTPRLKREIRRTSGTHVGFDRGRFSPSS